MSQENRGLPPPIVVSSHDLARLEAMLESNAWANNPAADALSDELLRATVVAPEDVPVGLVTMHSTVECEDVNNGEKHTLTVVYPNEANVDKGYVSVLAPVGSALLGLSIGQSINWKVPNGRELHLRVTAVHYQPEAAGNLAS